MLFWRLPPMYTSEHSYIWEQRKKYYKTRSHRILFLIQVTNTFFMNCELYYPLVSQFQLNWKWWPGDFWSSSLTWKFVRSVFYKNNTFFFKFYFACMGELYCFNAKYAVHIYSKKLHSLHLFLWNIVCDQR